jgi:ribosomal protein S18 acetylase RimI-like enzyme
MENLTMEIGPVAGEEELEEILVLQRQNLATAISPEEARSQGFVTVVHTLPVLRAMHASMPSVVARRAGVLAGYALAMPKAARALVPVLEPMFQTLEGLSFRGQPLRDATYYAMGQICVARDARGQGVFDSLYAGHRALYGARFDCLVTEVATRNTRSMRAHERVGFEIIHRYRDATDDWAVLAWDFGA